MSKKRDLRLELEISRRVEAEQKFLVAQSIIDARDKAAAEDRFGAPAPVPAPAVTPPPPPAPPTVLERYRAITNPIERMLFNLDNEAELLAQLEAKRR